tara:strand:+ start:34923 stop:36038 length:1116 start_codon:yes stop_codon:yes gene_type:complete
MKTNILNLVNPCIFDVNPYQPGKNLNECKREYGLTHFVKLASNENPLGPSPNVMQAIHDAISQIADYPDSHCYELRKALSEHYQLAFDQFIIGNGSEEILKMLLETFVMSGQEVIFGQYAFMAYDILAKSVGASIKKIPMPNWTLDLDQVLGAITPKTKMILLANPNNPTGTYIPEKEFRSFMQRVPSNVLVISDEAYYEYVQKADYPQTHSWLDQFPNLVITRTFSKAYGMAGMRVGYAMAHEDLVAIVNRIRQPFNVNHLAQVAALAAIKDQAFLQYSVEMNNKHREGLVQGLAELGIPYIPSQANFVMLHVKTDGMVLYENLLRMGVIIRPLKFFQLNHYVRVSVGLEEENKCFLNALNQALPKEQVA